MSSVVVQEWGNPEKTFRQIPAQPGLLTAVKFAPFVPGSILPAQLALLYANNWLTLANVARPLVGNENRLIDSTSELDTRSVHESSVVIAMDWSPSGRHILTLCSGGLICLWDLQTKKALRTILCKTNTFDAAYHSQNTNFVISADPFGIHMFNASTGLPVARFEHGAVGSFATAFCPLDNGNMIALGDSNGFVNFVAFDPVHLTLTRVAKIQVATKAYPILSISAAHATQMFGADVFVVAICSADNQFALVRAANKCIAIDVVWKHSPVNFNTSFPDFAKNSSDVASAARNHIACTITSANSATHRVQLACSSQGGEIHVFNIDWASGKTTSTYSVLPDNVRAAAEKAHVSRMSFSANISVMATLSSSGSVSLLLPEKAKT